MSSHVVRNDFSPIKLVKNNEDVNAIKNQRLRLIEMYKRLNKKEKFKVGQVVKWKKGLHNRKRPFPDEPAIITKILNMPTFDPSEENSASQFFREPLNIVIAIWDNGDFNELHVDGRRLELFK